MAEGTLRFGRGVYDIAYKICSRPHLESVNKQGKGAIRLSSLSAGCLLSDTSNCTLYGTENAVTQGVSPDSYTRVKIQLGVDTNRYGREAAAAIGGYNGLNKHYPLKKLHVKFSERTSRQCWIHPAVRRTLWTSRRVSLQRSLGGRYEWWVHGPFVFVRSYNGNGSRSEPLYKSKTGYYEILDVSPNATQAQVKTAYYKQSFIYHPDRNAGSDEATDRFSEINEAYTVLGNKALRKKYDRGLLSQSDLKATSKPSGKGTTVSSVKKQSDSQRTVMGAGQGRIFDFDKFYKEHYGEQLQRERDIRARKEQLMKKKQETIQDVKLDGLLELGVGLMLALALLILVGHRR